MQYYIVEFSKYLITFFAGIYTLESFGALFFTKGEEHRGLFIRQGIYLFFFQFFAYLCMCLMTGQIEYLFFYAFLQIALFSTMILHRMIYTWAEGLLLNHMCFLLSVGFVILTRIDFEKAKKQFFIVIIGLIFTLVLPILVSKMKFIRHLKWLYGMAGILALGIVLVLGQVTHGSKISYTVGGITLQPSEFVKILFVFFIASLLYRAKSLRDIVISGIFAGIHILILVASRDLGSSIIFFVGYLFMLFNARKQYRYLFLGFAAGSVAAVIGYQLFSHVRVRVQAFLDPFAAIDSEGYQMAQSLFAISNGKWFGTGLFEGTPFDIPFVTSDFIFSAIAEELGGIFAVAVILICLNCFLVFLRIGMKLEDRFYRLSAVGFAVMYIFQIFLTVGGGIKFIPLTGVTLPLVSYGGSSVLSTLIIFGIMQGLYLVSIEEKEEEEEDTKEASETGEYEETFRYRRIGVKKKRNGRD